MSSLINPTCKFMRYESKWTDLKDYLTMFKDDNKDNSSCFMLSCNSNINAKTRDLNCENDTTYTTICVPKQSLVCSYTVFELKINEAMSLQLEVQQNGAFTCSAHRQLHKVGMKSMNLSSYSSRSVFNNFRKSLERVKKRYSKP
jgi:hypothetical protein